MARHPLARLRVLLLQTHPRGAWILRRRSLRADGPLPARQGRRSGGVRRRRGRPRPATQRVRLRPRRQRRPRRRPPLPPRLPLGQPHGPQHLARGGRRRRRRRRRVLLLRARRRCLQRGAHRGRAMPPPTTPPPPPPRSSNPTAIAWDSSWTTRGSNSCATWPRRCPGVRARSHKRGCGRERRRRARDGDAARQGAPCVRVDGMEKGVRADCGRDVRLGRRRGGAHGSSLARSPDERRVGDYPAVRVVAAAAVLGAPGGCSRVVGGGVGRDHQGRRGPSSSAGRSSLESTRRSRTWRRTSRRRCWPCARSRRSSGAGFRRSRRRGRRPRTRRGG